MAGAGKAVSFVAGGDSPSNQPEGVHHGSIDPSDATQVADAGEPSPSTWGAHASYAGPSSPPVMSTADLPGSSGNGLAALSTAGWGASSVKSDADSRSPARGVADVPAVASPLHNVSGGPSWGHRRGLSNVSAGAASVGSTGPTWGAGMGSAAPQEGPAAGWGATESRTGPGSAAASGTGVEETEGGGFEQDDPVSETGASAEQGGKGKRFVPAAKWLLAGAGKAMTFVVGADGGSKAVEGELAEAEAGGGVSDMAPAGAFDRAPSPPAVDTAAQEAHYSGVAELMAASEARAASPGTGTAQEGGEGGGWRGFGGFFRGRGQQQESPARPPPMQDDDAGAGWAAFATAQPAATEPAAPAPVPPVSQGSERWGNRNGMPQDRPELVQPASFWGAGQPDADATVDAGGVPADARAGDPTAGVGSWGSSVEQDSGVLPETRAASADPPGQLTGTPAYSGWGASTDDPAPGAAAEEYAAPWHGATEGVSNVWGPAPAEGVAWGSAAGPASDEAQPVWSAQHPGHSGLGWPGGADAGARAGDAGPGVGVPGGDVRATQAEPLGAQSVADGFFQSTADGGLPVMPAGHPDIDAAAYGGHSGIESDAVARGGWQGDANGQRASGEGVGEPWPGEGYGQLHNDSGAGGAYAGWGMAHALFLDSAAAGGDAVVGLGAGAVKPVHGQWGVQAGSGAGSAATAGGVDAVGFFTNLAESSGGFGVEGHGVQDPSMADGGTGELEPDAGHVCFVRHLLWFFCMLAHAPACLRALRLPGPMYTRGPSQSLCITPEALSVACYMQVWKPWRGLPVRELRRRWQPVMPLRPYITASTSISQSSTVSRCTPAPTLVLRESRIQPVPGLTRRCLKIRLQAAMRNRLQFLTSRIPSMPTLWWRRPQPARWSRNTVWTHPPALHKVLHKCLRPSNRMCYCTAYHPAAATGACV